MSQRRRRYASLGLVLVAVVGLFYAACYDPTEPACGFRCGPNNACPDDYACGSDGVCHRNGTNEVCPTPDAPIADTPGEDVPGDVPGDVPNDVPGDVPIDAPADTPPPDAPPDAAVDAAIDA